MFSRPCVTSRGLLPGVTVSAPLSRRLPSFVVTGSGGSEPLPDLE